MAFGLFARISNQMRLELIRQGIDHSSSLLGHAQRGRHGALCVVRAGVRENGAGIALA
jgi:hypothetical protein